jgi:peptidoglycan/xylan/chitin deacetylase (PgdA/CDA1 family)
MRRRHLIVLTVIVVAVLALAGTLVLVASTRDDPTAAPAPTVSAPSTSTPTGPGKPDGTGGGGPVPGSSSGSTRQPTTTGGPTSAPGIPSALRGKDIEVIPTSQPVVALTFDAGANADGLPSILATLASRGVAATFFLTGSFAVDFPASARAITAAGHRIGNHTATHPHPLTLSDSALRNQLTTAENQLRAAGAGDPRPLFRFPYGERDARTIAAVNAAGYVAVRWTVDSLGWQGLNGRTPQAAATFVTNRVLAAARAGAIVLMHVGSHPEDRTTLDATVLPTVIDQLRARGYRFVTLNALLS